MNGFQRLSQWLSLQLSAAMIAGLWLGTAAAYEVPRVNQLYTFVPEDYPVLGNFELSPLLQGADGDFYGVSAYGGTSSWGTVYKVSRLSGQLTHLHDFQYQDGRTPRGQLTQTADGSLYGTTEAGGAHQADNCLIGQFYDEGGCGTLFRISPSGEFTKLHDFYSADDGYLAAPITGVVEGPDGKLYGLATISLYNQVATALFRYDPETGAFSTAYAFPTDGSQGSRPYGGLIVGSDGALYGTTGNDGAIGDEPSAGCGTVFRLGLDGSFLLLHTFSGGGGAQADGCLPWAKLIEAQDGNFYGTTLYGGYVTGNCRAGGCGTVFRVSPQGDYTVLHRFTATAGDGEYPQGAGLVQTANGQLYGVTGGNPYGDGYGYVPYCSVNGDTSFSCGTVYSIDSDGQFTQLHDFGVGNSADGLFPHASLILASDGNLYGSTFAGGGWGYGTLWRLVLDDQTPILAIDSIDPPGSAPGVDATFYGVGLAGVTQVRFGDGQQGQIDAEFTVLSDTALSATVPALAESSAPSVTSARGTVYSPQSYYLQPVIDSITPETAHRGQSVTLSGAHFQGISAITFTGGATTTDWSYVNSQRKDILVGIPWNAISGPIMVNNPGGTGVSPPLTIQSWLRPRQAQPGPVTAISLTCRPRPTSGEDRCKQTPIATGAGVPSPD